MAEMVAMAATVMVGIKRLSRSADKKIYSSRDLHMKLTEWNRRAYTALTAKRIKHEMRESEAHARTGGNQAGSLSPA